MKFTFSFIVAAFLFTSCANQNNEVKNTPEIEVEEDHTMGGTDNSHLYTNVQFAMDKDPVCMMPLSAGITDTAVINGKNYGFCSPQCKETYVKENRK